MTGRLLREAADLGGYRLEPGTVILIAIYLLHTKPETYPDPYEFRPERFLDDAPETYSWIPFGGGTRRCLGAAFAQMEMRVALRSILGALRMEPAEPRAARMVRRNVTLTPANGAPVVVAERL
jgi:cytochrome P450 family 135